MKAIYFPEVNLEIAKDQPEFNTLPAYFSKEGILVTCFELDEKEIESINRNKKIWVQTLKGFMPLQPFSLIAVNDYFKSVVTDGTKYHVADEDVVDQAVNDLLEKEKVLSGIELISQERSEQFEKHHRTIALDKQQNTDGQLREAAVGLLEDPLEYRTLKKPLRWNEEIWVKMCKKSYKERLIIAGALMAAEIDRVQ